MTTITHIPVHKGTGHKDTPLSALCDRALMCTLNFSDTDTVDYSPTRQAIRDYDALTRMIREYGGDCTLAGLQAELLALVKLTAQAITR